MTHQRIIPRRALAIATLLLVLMLLVAAAVNVPWALTFMQSRLSIVQVPTQTVRGPEANRPWPASTPHDDPWPVPNVWSEGRLFGCRTYNVRSIEKNFVMQVQHLGWPLPVIEQKQMWWDWNDPALAGPEPDPSPSLLLKGLLLNPVLLGGGAWIVLVLPWVAAIIGVRNARHRKNRCLDCGYPAKTNSERCSECGSEL